MNGVVLWSCLRTRRAIIWCDDHRQLAYAKGAAGFAPGARFPETGDLVAFTATQGAEVRHASAVRVIGPGTFPHLDRLLLGQAPAPAPRLAPVPAD